MADQVLIVGAGPTGLTAALELSRLGVSVRIIDR
jgi:2-polyprenyl-6-methoxyphenol hydroxylase-like FAD-dependent oxidoreductase